MSEKIVSILGYEVHVLLAIVMRELISYSRPSEEGRTRDTK